MIAVRVTVRGVVQGVGFRPFVFNLAERFGLGGWVLNHSGGVEIEAEGPPEQVEAFVAALRAEAPPLAHIESLETHRVPVRRDGGDGEALPRSFEIRHSERQEGRYQLISPDIATCADCLRELLDPVDRRYRYPFINCTNCGPRFTIIADIPYDRPDTTMRVFLMCPDCQQEYDDPRNRRFHAQPNACPICGPRVELVKSRKLKVASCKLRPESDVIEQAAVLLRNGAIVAIKGLGGFHLACDATNADAVRTLRARKRRPHKPLAVMMATMDEVRRHCQVSSPEEALLTSPQCPIVLLPWRAATERATGDQNDRLEHRPYDVVPDVAPRYRYLGVMLPYTPLHHVLLRDVGRPLVMTSGNLTEEPIAAENDEALRRLGHLADAFLLHNRDIYARYDDSVWFVPQPLGDRRPSGGHGGPPLRSDDGASPLRSGGHGGPPLRPQPIRRARGYAPFPVKLPFQVRQVLACGAEIVNTFCLTRDEYAFVSQHIGDMENLETLEHFERTIELYKRLFRIEPEVVAYDPHPGYLASRYAREQGSRTGDRGDRDRREQGAWGTTSQPPNHPTTQPPDPVLCPVQHHHAHLAACLADNGWQVKDGPVIGVSLDGTGYGEDGHIWGGEWLVGRYEGYRRVGHLEYLPLPGGDAATRNPWRIAASYLYALLGEIPANIFIRPQDVSPVEVELVRRQIDRQLNCPFTSSMGRLFDAVSALLGVCVRTTYEGQAAIELEMVASGQIGKWANGEWANGEWANGQMANGEISKSANGQIDPSTSGL